MIITKLIVLICFIKGFSANPIDYCEICVNHTLCKYKTQGPSVSCKLYDSSALLTSQDITELINRINERRNFVAMGYSKVLPQAADMKKIRWSNELARFAQRWADQCDPSVRPDKEDQCRDLENTKVGQSIGSVIGPSPGLNVKGFVEMWFIQVLDYAGSVTYYNRSQDNQTNCFTQLIWADTEFVGCGKAKFYVDERKRMLERLVCNFAPKGNTHGKPVYSIGYPGTQCKNNMVADASYKGLCNYGPEILFTKLTTQERPVNSLLRILNLSNDSVKHEIDPVRNIITRTNVNSNSSNQHRNQKTRHIFSNKTYATVKRIPQLRKQMPGNNPINISGNDRDYHYQHDRGHSHLYHGHEPPRYNFEYTTLINTIQDFRRYDYTTEPMNSYSNTNYRKFNQYAQCTRTIRPTHCASNPCSAALDNCCQQTTTCSPTCPDIPCTPPTEDCTTCMPPVPNLCECAKLTCPQITTNCNYHTGCKCNMPCSTNIHCLTTICPGLRKNNDISDYRRTGTFQYYDAIPNVVVRSGGNYKSKNTNSSKEFPFVNFDLKKTYKTMYEEIDSDQIHEGTTDNSKYELQDRDYLYRSYGSSLRKKRQMEDTNFWQIENFNNKKLSQLKSIKYTTLANSKITEPITLRLTDYVDYQSEPVSEKYLSFDELMHLRKINDGYVQYDLRRQGKKPTGSGTTKSANSSGSRGGTKGFKTPPKHNTSPPNISKLNLSSTLSPPSEKSSPPSKIQAEQTQYSIARRAKTKATTTEYTVNTPFERKKYCTRKLTCTWTAFTINDKGDNQILGPMIEAGSRTPPGYVEGCTRTSTCTRDYMDRNKISTIGEGEGKDSSDGLQEGLTATTTTGDDDDGGDYCERRSLNVQRRNSDEKDPSGLLFRYLDDTIFYTQTTTTTAVVKSEPVFNSYLEGPSKTHDCICCYDKNVRQKREDTECLRYINNRYETSKNYFSYGDLYYLVLNKILKANQANKKIHNSQCPCNDSKNYNPVAFLFLFIFLIHFNKISSYL